MKPQFINTQVPDDISDKIQKIADERLCSKSAVVRGFIVDGLKNIGERNAKAKSPSIQ
jgi:hypothetical protein